MLLRVQLLVFRYRIRKPCISELVTLERGNCCIRECFLVFLRGESGLFLVCSSNVYYVVRPWKFPVIFLNQCL